jgi:acyl-CoA thioesterase FadM
MRFKKTERVHFDQADPAGILFFAKAFEMAHHLIEDFIDHIGLRWSDWFENPQSAAPIRRAEADYRGPLRAGHKYDLELSVTRLSETSVDFQVEFKSAGEVLATVKTVHTFVDREKKQKTFIPTAVRDKLARYIT